MEIINWLRGRGATRFHTIVFCKADNNHLGDIIMGDLVWDSDAFDVQLSVEDSDLHADMVEAITLNANYKEQYDTVIEAKWSKDWSGWTNIDSYFDPSESTVSQSVIGVTELPFDEFKQVLDAITEDDDYTPFVVIRFLRSDQRIYTFFVDNEADVRAGYYVELTDAAPLGVKTLLDFFE